MSDAPTVAAQSPTNEFHTQNWNQTPRLSGQASISSQVPASHFDLSRCQSGTAHAPDNNQQTNRATDCPQPHHLTSMHMCVQGRATVSIESVNTYLMQNMEEQKKGKPTTWACIAATVTDQVCVAVLCTTEICRTENITCTYYMYCCLTPRLISGLTTVDDCR